MRGFLSLLENAVFPRNDLYLFELLQNAVDDDASRVSFTASADGLRVFHDGREFTPLDVFGLSSVGFSAKSGRTVGFMGVGFKAVYKRYRQVTVRDSTWSFRFEEPARRDHRGETRGTNGWVLMPQWPVQSKLRAPLFATRTLNATGPSRVTLSLRQSNLRAACGLRQEERGPEIRPQKRYNRAGQLGVVTPRTRK